MNGPTSNIQFTVASLFAGMGGFAIAFRRAGFLPTWANEIDKHAARTYLHNLPESNITLCDVKDFSPHSIGLEPPDVLTGGFPCQPFSSAGDRRGLEDERGVLYLEIARILREYGNYRPKIVLLENVGNLLGHNGGRTFAAIENELKLAGYWVLPCNIKRLNTRIHTDIPQNRERVFIVAMSTATFSGGRFQFPDTESFCKPISEFLDLDRRADDYYYFDTDENRFGRMILDCVENGSIASVYQLRRSYVREYKDFVPTLTANMGDGGHNVPVIVDKWGLRKLTPTECARLQGYGDPDAQIPESVSRVQAYKQIGNSVTVPLVEKLAHECKRVLETQSKRERVA